MTFELVRELRMQHKREREKMRYRQRLRGEAWSRPCYTMAPVAVLLDWHWERGVARGSNGHWLIWARTVGCP